VREAAGMNFELRQLKHAMAVAEHGNFAQAALALHLSQSALSRSVQALERGIGAQLFVRSAQGVMLTDTGRDVLRQGREMLLLAAEVDTQFFRNRSLQGGSLGIGVGTAASEPSAVDATRAFVAEFPTVRVELRAAFRTDLLPSLKTGQLDLLLADSTLFAQEPELEVEALEAHPLVVFVRPGHPLTRRTAVTLPEVFGFPVMSLGRIQPGLLAPLLEEQAATPAPVSQLRPMPSVICNSLALLERLVRSSDAVASAAPSVLRPRIEDGTLVALLAPAWLHTPFGIVHLPSRVQSAAALSFREHLRMAHAKRAAEDRQLVRAWFGDTARGAS
jgi:DNA-binding transcriptional LysR family regulator